MPEVIASYLIDTGERPVLIETGPDSVFSNLKSGLANLGLRISDIKEVFVSHIHLDHAGSAWRFAKEGATIHVHPFGAKHMHNPEKLLASARMIYKDEMDRLWGEVHPIPEERIKPALDGDVMKWGDTEIRVFETKGHASHHNIYLVNDILFTGDIGGIKISNGPVIPPTPPPDINIELWRDSIQKIRSLNPSFIYPTHFGRHGAPEEYLAELETRLMNFALWGKEMVTSGRSDADIEKECDNMIRRILKDSGADDALIRKYELADPFSMNAGGLIRYWRKKLAGSN